MKAFLVCMLALILAGCDTTAGVPTIDREINADVDGYTGQPKKFLDEETGVVCYYIYYKTMSCVQVQNGK